MTTVINNPGGGEDSSGAGIIIGVIVGIILIVVFIFYILPAIRDNGNNDGADINIDLVPESGGNEQSAY